jgi:hypothetical protein
MTQSENPEIRIRANLAGHPCPGWCTVNHGEPVIPGKPQYGYMAGHTSDALAEGSVPLVKVTQYPGVDAGPQVHLQNTYGTVFLNLDVVQAEKLAELLAIKDGAGDLLADQLRTAAAIARDTK